MATPSPDELAREFRFLIPSGPQLWAVSRRAEAAANFLSALDWMYAIVSPFISVQLLRLDTREAPERVTELANTLQAIGRTYDVVDTIGNFPPPGERVQQVGSTLRGNLKRWLDFEELTLEGVARLVEPDVDFNSLSRSERIRRFSTGVVIETPSRAASRAAGNLLTVNLIRTRERFWRAGRFDFPTRAEDWAPLLD